MAKSASTSRVLTDHEEIRRWAEERGAKPACVRGTGGKDDIGMIRLEFPDYSGREDSLEEIDWDEWFENLTTITWHCLCKRKLRVEKRAISTNLLTGRMLSKVKIIKVIEVTGKRTVGNANNHEAWAVKPESEPPLIPLIPRVPGGVRGVAVAAAARTRPQLGRAHQAGRSSPSAPRLGGAPRKTGRQANASTTSRSSSGRKGPSRSSSKGRSSKSA